MKRFLKCLLRLTLIFIGVLGALYIGLRAMLHCDPSVTSSIIIKNTPWIAELRSMDCTRDYNTSYGEDIRLVNTKTGKTVTVAKGFAVTSIEMLSNEDGKLILTLSNRSPARLLPVEIGDVHITYNYTPKDDPLDRASYLAWYWGDRGNESNRIWYCTNFFSKVPEKQKAQVDRMLAAGVNGLRDSNKYCLK